MAENSVEKKTGTMKKGWWAVVSVAIVVLAALALLGMKLGWFSLTGNAAGNTFSLTVTTDGETVLFDGELKALEGECLLDTMCRCVTDDGGVEYSESGYGAYITSICGQAEDGDAGRYWTYTINGEYAASGVSECFPEEGDAIAFDLSAMEW